MSTSHVLERLGASMLIPIVTVDDPAEALALGDALLRGGLGCIEVTLRTPAGLEAIRRLKHVGDLLVGAGTVLSAEDAVAAARAGADFAVAPGTNGEVVHTFSSLGLPFFPGVATASEIEHARRLGARVVKVFPASLLGGPAFVRAVSATYPDMRFIPTGGIDAGSIGSYLALDSVPAVGGSWLRTGSQAEDVTRLVELARIPAAKS